MPMHSTIFGIIDWVILATKFYKKHTSTALEYLSSKNQNSSTVPHVIVQSFAAPILVRKKHHHCYKHPRKQQSKYARIFTLILGLLGVVIFQNKILMENWSQAEMAIAHIALLLIGHHGSSQWFLPRQSVHLSPNCVTYSNNLNPKWLQLIALSQRTWEVNFQDQNCSEIS